MYPVRYLAIALVVALLSLGRPLAAAVIDLMLVYDTTATSWVAGNGGMAAFSQDVVNRMNQAMSNSNAGVVFRHVHSMSVAYTTTATPSTGFEDDLKVLRVGSGAFAAVHTARNTYGADVVAMVADHGSAYGYVGVGYLLNSWSGQPNYAFSVSAIRSVAISHTLTHEVGHNLGLHHSKTQKSYPGPNTYLTNPSAPYSAGWYFTGSNNVKYHTIMAYGNDGTINYQEAPLFSSPLINWNGTTAGHAVDGDNTRLLREISDTVAGYRATVSGYTLTVNSSAASGLVITGNPGTYSGTSNYTIEGIASGTAITLTAPASSGEAIFSSWSGCDSSSGSSCSLNLTANRIVTANYVLVCGQPATLSVPTGDDDGNYTVSWAASSTSDVVYILEEATDADFSRNLRTAYSGNATSAAINGRSSGVMYFYRVKATRGGYLDSTWAINANPCTVSIEGLGSLVVHISPQAAVDAGARWSIDGGSTWQTSGESLNDLTIHNNPYTITFRILGGWTSPVDQVVTIESGKMLDRTVSYTAPEITVSCNGLTLSNGTGSYDFGQQRLNVTHFAPCTIRNTGSSPLLLTGTPLLSIAGDPSFIGGQPSTDLITVGHSATFALGYYPVNGKASSATITIANNTPAANPFSFSVSGQGLINLSWLMLLLE